MDELSQALAASGNSAGLDTMFLVVDHNSRTITVPAKKKIIGVEHDDDVNRLYFRMPRFANGTDLSEFQFRINYTNALNEGDLYIVMDKEVLENTITFSWILDRPAFAKKGEISFVICARLIGENDLVLKEYNTTVQRLTVLEGLETDKAVPVDVQDHFLDWLHEETANEIIRIQSEGQEVLDSIPEDYFTLAEQISDLQNRLNSLFIIG